MFGQTGLMYTKQGMAMAKLFYLVGASGSGKDSLIAYARTHLSSDKKVIFCHRYITRSAKAGGENHIALSDKEFALRHAMGCFAMNWHSHQMHYGIGIEINQWLEKGINVVVNGSRAYLNEAARLYPQLSPVSLNVAPEILRERLQHRGREGSEEIEHRLTQAKKLETTVDHPHLVKIENNGVLEEAGKKFIQIIEVNKKAKCA